MGRKNLYETHVKPYFDKIKTWSRYETEESISKRLGLNKATFSKYKSEHKELAEILKAGKQDLVMELKDALRKKALGFHYEETKTTTRKEGGKTVVSVEKYNKYSPPDTVAAHLLLKNYDSKWHNDDAETIAQKRKALEQTDRRIENSEF